MLDAMRSPFGAKHINDSMMPYSYTQGPSW